MKANEFRLLHQPVEGVTREGRLLAFPHAPRSTSERTTPLQCVFVYLYVLPACNALSR